MAGPLPHTSEIQEMVGKYLDDANDIIACSVRGLYKSETFRMIYRISLAASAALAQLENSRTRPRFHGVKSIALRVPLLVAIRQIGVAYRELRRFAELSFWSIYFSEHPVEWACFEMSSDSGYAREIDSPINYCAHRELKFYANYAKERMKQEASGIARQAAILLQDAVEKVLNSLTHAGDMASSVRKIPPMEDVSEISLTEFSKVQRCVFANGVLLLAAYNVKKFDRMGPTQRAHFDWLVQKKISKLIRSQTFGLGS